MISTTIMITRIYKPIFKNLFIHAVKFHPSNKPSNLSYSVTRIICRLPGLFSPPGCPSGSREVHSSHQGVAWQCPHCSTPTGLHPAAQLKIFLVANTEANPALPLTISGGSWPPDILLPQAWPPCCLKYPATSASEQLKEKKFHK